MAGPEDGPEAHCKCCFDWEQRVFALEDATAWRAIETAPKDGKCILLHVPEFYEYGGMCGAIVGFWNANFDVWGLTSAASLVAKPSHWMPLPKAP